MSSNHRPTDIEARLDAAIDALNAGRPVSTNGDPELTSLLVTIQHARATAEPEWPDAGFPARMARNLVAQLQAIPLQTTRTDNGNLTPPPTLDDQLGPFSRRATGPATLADNDRRPSRRRQIAGIVAAGAAFSLLTLLLITVFDAWRSPSAVYYDNVGGNDDPRQIAFVKDVDGQAEIFLITSDGDDLANLTDHAANDRAPAWSPDGHTLAFVSDRTGRDEIYLMDADGGNVRQLTDASTPSRSPTWSPDGQFVAFIRMRDGIRDQPWVMNADSTDQRPLSSSEPLEEIVEPIVWSPDSTMIAYIFDDASVGLGLSSVVDDRSMVAGVDSVDIQFVDWSSDGKWITFNTLSGTNQIKAFNAQHPFSDMQEFRSLTREPGLNESQAQWSPTGDAIIFFGSSRTSSEHTRGLYRMLPDGSSQQQLASRQENRPFVRARWSPDGEQIAFLAVDGSRMNPSTSDGLTGDVFELVVLDYETGDQHELADDIWTGFDDPPAWRPRPSDSTAPPPTAVPQPAQTAVPIWDATSVIPSPEGSPSPDPEETIAILTPTPPATGDFAAQVQAALDALPDDMVGCGATPGTFITLDESNTVDPTEYRGVALVGKEPLNALLFGVENDTLQQSVGPSGEATIFWNLGPLAAEDLELDAKELRRGTEIDPVLGTVLGNSGWINPAHLISVTFPHAGCWQFIATYGGELAGVVWIEVAESQMDEPAETDQPALSVAPAIGTCETVPVIRGTGFEPGTQVTIHLGLARRDNAVPLGEYPTVAEDGTFEVEADLSNAVAAMCQSGQIPTVGANYLISATTGTGPKSDGDNWRDPSASTTYVVVGEDELAEPGTLDTMILNMAEQIIRAEFLGDPDAEFEGEIKSTPSGERQAVLTRQAQGLESPDEFVVDVLTSELVWATIDSNTTQAAPSNPVDTNEAVAIAEEVARRTYSKFDQLTFVNVDGNGVVTGANGPDPIAVVEWRLQTDGVWMPTWINISVDLETGRVVHYVFIDTGYRGPRIPQITEDEARNIALADIAADPEIAGSTIREMLLEATSIVVETAPTASDPRGKIFEVTATDQRLAWTAYLEDDGRPGGRRHIWVDAITGEILNPMGSANG